MKKLTNKLNALEVKGYIKGAAAKAKVMDILTAQRWQCDCYHWAKVIL